MIFIIMSKLDIMYALHTNLASLSARQGIKQDEADQKHIYVAVNMLPHRKSSTEALEQLSRRSRTRALIRECSMLMLNLQLQQLAYRTQDNLKSCPEAVSGLGVLKCLKNSEGKSLTKRIFDLLRRLSHQIS